MVFNLGAWLFLFCHVNFKERLCQRQQWIWEMWQVCSPSMKREPLSGPLLISRSWFGSIIKWDYFNDIMFHCPCDLHWSICFDLILFSFYQKRCDDCCEAKTYGGGPPANGRAHGGAITLIKLQLQLCTWRCNYIDTITITIVHMEVQIQCLIINTMFNHKFSLKFYFLDYYWWTFHQPGERSDCNGKVHKKKLALIEATIGQFEENFWERENPQKYSEYFFATGNSGARVN